MAFKLIVLLAVLALANAGHLPYAAPVAPLTYSAPAIPAPAHPAYAAPIAKLAPAPLAYAAPVAKIAPAPLAYARPIAKVAAPVALAKTIDDQYDPNPQYSYAYDVQDSLTGDNKQQEETRNGDSVQGRYSFIEADGSRRVVEYTADPINGFNAVVHKEPAVAVKAVAPAPLLHAAPAPLVHAAPVHSAPLNLIH